MRAELHCAKGDHHEEDRHDSGGGRCSSRAECVVSSGRRLQIERSTMMCENPSGWCMPFGYLT